MADVNVDGQDSLSVKLLDDLAFDLDISTGQGLAVSLTEARLLVVSLTIGETTAVMLADQVSPLVLAALAESLGLRLSDAALMAVVTAVTDTLSVRLTEEGTAGLQVILQGVDALAGALGDSVQLTVTLVTTDAWSTVLQEFAAVLSGMVALQGTDTLPMLLVEPPDTFIALTGLLDVLATGLADAAQFAPSTFTVGEALRVVLAGELGVAAQLLLAAAAESLGLSLAELASTLTLSLTQTSDGMTVALLEAGTIGPAGLRVSDVFSIRLQEVPVILVTALIGQIHVATLTSLGPIRTIRPVIQERTMEPVTRNRTLEPA